MTQMPSPEVGAAEGGVQASVIQIVLRGDREWQCCQEVPSLRWDVEGCCAHWRHQRQVQSDAMLSLQP